LWRPGAQKLLQWFQLGFTCERVEVERDAEGRKHGITYRAEVFRQLPGGVRQLLATCEGTADYDESKFYQTAEEVQRKAEYNERKWAKQYKRVADPTKWQNRSEYRADWNALMKRAQKRAIVGATTDATAAGGIFSDREDDDSPVPQDDGPGWYEEALEQALTFTDIAAGNELYVQAVQAHRDGRATRGQKDHVQNRVRQRTTQLKAHPQVNVEDLADVPLAEASHPAATADATGPAGGTRTVSTARQIEQHFGRIGVTDPNDQLISATQILRLDDVPGSISKLTAEQQREVRKALTSCRDLDALQALLATGEQDANAEAPDGQ
jgi:hypothetical protein